MTDVELLKRKMAAHGDFHFTNDLASILKISRPTASGKLHNKIQFSQGDIKILADRYDLSYREIGEIFIDLDE